MNKVLLLVLLFAFPVIAQDFSIEGHRGARGYVPENTIPSFIKALELGSDTLELDVVVSKDNKLVFRTSLGFLPLFRSIKMADRSRRTNSANIIFIK